jgi:hypothetical protein
MKRAQGGGKSANEYYVFGGPYAARFFYQWDRCRSKTISARPAPPSTAKVPSMNPPAEPVSIAGLEMRIARLEYQAHAILYLSGVNLFLNAIMIFASALIAWA